MPFGVQPGSIPASQPATTQQVALSFEEQHGRHMVNTWKWFICHSSGLTGTLAGEVLLTFILRQTLKLSVSKRCRLPLKVSAAHAQHSEGAEYVDLSRCFHLLGKSAMLRWEGTSLQGRQSGSPHLQDS